ELFCVDLALRQRLLQPFDGVAADFRVDQPQLYQVGESLKMRQPGLGDGGSVEVQSLKVLQRSQVCQTRIRHGRFVEKELSRAGQGSQPREPGVADLGPTEAKPSEASEALQTTQSLVGDLGAVQLQGFEPRQPCERGQSSIG